MTAHHITQDQGSGDIVVIILQWLVYRLTNCLQTCKMNDCINLLILEDVLKCRLVQKICLIECYRLSGNLLHTL